MLKTLPELTAADITAIIQAPNKRRTSSKNFHIVRVAPGVLERRSGKPKAAQAGSFIGKAGTMTRSRKGRVRRNANGSRTYNGLEQIVAYKVTP